MYRFVRAKGDEQTRTIKRHKVQIGDGNTARETYEDILQMPSTSATNNKISSIRRRTRAQTKQIIAFEKNHFFKAAQSNDIATLEKIDLNSTNVNVTDAFDWTALMMASYEGHLNIVKFLIRAGAIIDAEDKQNNSAITLASKQHHTDVVDLLEKTLKNQKCEIIDLSSDEDVTEPKISNPIHCDACQLTYEKSNEKDHLASTLHRFNVKESHKFTRHFGIPESNVGFRMMMRQGWNRDTGLGPDQSGIIYPIKTTLRKSRTGLGTRQPKTAKVTHFKAFDRDAIKSQYAPPIQIVTTRKQMKADKLKNQRKDRYLRRLLS